MKLFISLIGLFILCGCAHVYTPYRVGDKLELIRDVYLLEEPGKSFPNMTVNIKSKSKGVWYGFPVEVSEKNIGKYHVDIKIVGILKAETVLEILKFDLNDAVDYTYTSILLRNVITGEKYDLSNNRLVDSYSTKEGIEYVLTPLVFKPLNQ